MLADFSARGHRPIPKGVSASAQARRKALTITLRLRECVQLNLGWICGMIETYTMSRCGKWIRLRARVVDTCRQRDIIQPPWHYDEISISCIVFTGQGKPT